MNDNDFYPDDEGTDIARAVLIAAALSTCFVWIPLGVWIGMTIIKAVTS